MKTILIDVYNEKVEVIDVEPNLETFYEKIDCRCIDIVRRKIGKKIFTIVCDDEGLFHEPQKISAINNIGEPMLVGNLMIFNEKANDLSGLSNDDVEYIRKYVGTIFTRKYPDGYLMLTQTEYDFA